MAKRYYTSSADARTLNMTGGITGSPTPSTSITLNTVTTETLPTNYPFTLVIDPDVPGKEEIVTVTGKTSTYTWTVVRASNGTSAVAHDNAAVVKHMVTARDLQESQDHIDAASAYSILNDNSNASVVTTYITKSLHGIASGEGNVVGTDKAQTLTAKSLTSPTLTGTVNATSATLNLGTGGSITANSVTISAAELGYLDGLTSTIQTQIDSKSPIASPTFTGTVTIPTGSSITSPTISGGTISSATLTSPTINDATINSASTIGGISGTTIAADRTAWTSVTPTITSGWTGTPLLRYKQIGKTVHFRYTFSVAAGGSTAADMTVTLPVAAVAPTSIRHVAFGEFTTGVNTGSRWLLSAPIVTSSGTSTFTIYHNSSGGGLTLFTPSTPSTSTGNNTIVVAGTYEAA